MRDREGDKGRTRRWIRMLEMIQRQCWRKWEKGTGREAGEWKQTKIEE